MNTRTAWLASAAIVALAGASSADAATKHHKPVHKAAAGTKANGALLEEVRALRAQVESLQSKVDTGANAQMATQSQVEAQQAQITATQTKVDTTVSQVTTAQADITKRIDKDEHPDKIHFKGITITPGGYLEAAGIYRSRFQGDDIASSFSIPFPGQSHPSHTAEGRFSARQSRVSILAEGNPNKSTKLGAYMELDFQGAAQTSNSNQSNSYVPRIRNVYATMDWDRGSYGVHFLGGQNWSLLTMQGKGMSPRSEVTPPQIDAQYVPGFAWARQPGLRLTVDTDDHKLWFGASAENPQTTFGGTGVPAGVVSVVNGQGLTGLGTITCPANGAATSTVTCTITSTQQGVPTGSFQQFYNGAGSSLSLNQVPDFIGKVAYEDSIMGHTVHVEGFGIYRTFSTHLDGTQTNRDVHSWGYGGSIAVNVIPKILDVQFSGIGGKGIGRYGSAGLPDVTSDKAGNLHPIKEFMLLAGGTLHATPKLDLYTFAGEEQEYRTLLDGGTTGLGLPTANNSGCFLETATTTSSATCAGNTRRIRQITAGFWDKFYQGPFGRAQVGIQYSYTERQLFKGTGFTGYPQTFNNMVFLSFRYYPF